MRRKSVVSSNISSIGYDPESRILEVEFNNGSIYHYYGVTEALYNGLMSATSHGSFLHQMIKDRFRYTRIR